MSLIVARKENEKIIILSDTKLTAIDQASLRSKNAPSDGTIKTIILNEQACLAFAGKIGFAEEAVQEASIEKDPSKQLQILVQANGRSSNQTEFILAWYDGKPRIAEIKYGYIHEQESAWIGSHPAFNRFQSYMANGVNRNTTGSFIQVTFQPPSFKSDLYGKMIAAMDGVINDEDLQEVNGFKVCVVFEQSSFKYFGYSDTYQKPWHIEIKEPGSHSFPFTHASAAEGGYSINFFHSPNNYHSVGIHVKQGKFGIIYSRENGGLMNPKIVKEMDEVDFVDFALENFQIRPAIITEDKADKYYQKGILSFNKKLFKESLADFEVAINASNGITKAKMLFAKGVCLLHLRDLPKAMVAFQEAVKLNVNYQNEASRLVQTFMRFGKI